MIICDKAYLDDLDHLHADVLQFYELYFNCFITGKQDQAKATITFKMHNLSHYAQCIRLFGPLLFLSTCKYERLHQLMKSFVAGSFNRRNPPFSTISSYAKVWFNHALEETTSSIFLDFISSEDIGTIDAAFHRFIDCESDLEELKEVVEFDIQFKKDFVFVYYAHDVTNRNLPLFARVTRMFKQDDRHIILAKLMKTVTFDRNGHYYIVEMDSNRSQVVQLETKNLPWYKNLRLHQHKDYTVIEKDFHFGYVGCHDGILSDNIIV